MLSVHFTGLCMLLPFCSVSGSAQFGSTFPTCVGITVQSWMLRHCRWNGIENKRFHSCSVKMVLKWISSHCSSVSSYPPSLLLLDPLLPFSLLFPSLQIFTVDATVYPALFFPSSYLLFIYFLNLPFEFVVILFSTPTLNLNDTSALGCCCSCSADTVTMTKWLIYFHAYGFTHWLALLQNWCQSWYSGQSHALNIKSSALLIRLHMLFSLSTICPINGHKDRKIRPSRRITILSISV